MLAGQMVRGGKEGGTVEDKAWSSAEDDSDKKRCSDGGGARLNEAPRLFCVGWPRGVTWVRHFLLGLYRVPGKAQADDDILCRLNGFGSTVRQTGSARARVDVDAHPSVVQGSPRKFSRTGGIVLPLRRGEGEVEKLAAKDNGVYKYGSATRWHRYHGEQRVHIHESCNAGRQSSKCSQMMLCLI